MERSGMITLTNRSRYAFTLAALAVIGGNRPGQAKERSFEVPTPVVVPVGQSIEIDDASWAKAKEQEAVKQWLAANLLVPGEAGKRSRHHADLANDPAQGDLDGRRTGALSGMTQPEAIEYVSLIEDTDELHSLAGMESRPKLKAAIQRRLRELGA